MVPLHFLLPEPEIPILPIFVNTWIDPLPTPARCHALGNLIRQVADAATERVAMLATGGLSHFPGSPRIGEIDTSFDEGLLQKMRMGQGSALAGLTLDQLRQSGNSEFLNWMVTIGAWAKLRPPRPSTCPTTWPPGGGSRVGESDVRVWKGARSPRARVHGSIT